MRGEAVVMTVMMEAYTQDEVMSEEVTSTPSLLLWCALESCNYIT